MTGYGRFSPKVAGFLPMFVEYNPEEDVSHFYRWRVPYLRTGGEHISPASCDAKLVPVGKRQEEVLPAAKLEQRRYNKAEMFPASKGGVYIGGRREYKSPSGRTPC